MTGSRSRVLVIAAIAVLLAAVAIGAAAAEPAQSSASRVDQPAAVAALSVVLTLFAMALSGLVAYAVFVWLTTLLFRRGRGTGNGVVAPVWVQIVAVGVLVGMVAATFTVLFHFRRGGQTVGPASFLVRPGKLPSAHNSALPYSWTAGGATAVTVVLVLAAVFGMPRLLRILRRHGAPNFAKLRRSDGPAWTLDAPLLAALSGIAIADPRAEADPRQAVIAAWLAMTEAIGRLWRPRVPSEAPREYLDDALVSAGVQPASASRLTDLFERARWGNAVVGESMRSEAIAALDTVRTELRLLA